MIFDEGHYGSHMMDWHPGSWPFMILGAIFILLGIIAIIYISITLFRNYTVDNQLDHIESGKTLNNRTNIAFSDTEADISDIASFCPSCGEKLGDRTVKYCPYCGVKI